MTVPATVVTGAGLRAVRLYELAADGTIKAHATPGTWYSGIVLQGARALTASVPAARRTTHQGDDTFLGYTILPPNEGTTAEIRSAKKNLALDALLKGTPLITTGESQYLPQGTDREGKEIQVCILAYQTGNDNDDDSANRGAPIWSSVLMPRATLYSKRGSLDDNAYEHSYDVTPYIVNKFPWGLPLDIATHKIKMMQLLDGGHDGQPLLLSTMADGVLLAFPFPAGVVAYSASKVTVYKNGALVSSGVTATTAGITFTVAPLVTDKLIAHIEAL